MTDRLSIILERAAARNTWYRSLVRRDELRAALKVAESVLLEAGRRDDAAERALQEMRDNG